MRHLTGFVAFAALATAAGAAPPEGWVASWETSQQQVEPNNMLPPGDMSGATVRQVIRLSAGGRAFRLVLSNAFGSAPLHIKTVHIAKSLGGDAADSKTDRVLGFNGKADVTIPAGGAWVSDPVDQPVTALSDLAISIQYDNAPAIQTGHPGSRQTSYVLAGDHTGEAHLAGAKTVDHWYQIASVEVLSPASAIVALGDSITDGRGSTTNGNDRWTDMLAQKLGGLRAVLNAGIGGNCVLVQCLGPNAISRLERDVFSPPGVRDVIFYEGVNDLGGLTVKAPATPQAHAALVENLIAGFRQVAARAHAHGLKAYIGTILPYRANSYYHPDAANEADRSNINTWIRSQTEFDGVIDFDAALRDPARPDYLNPAYDSGDGLHPSPAGYRVMGDVAARALNAEIKTKAKK